MPARKQKPTAPIAPPAADPDAQAGLAAAALATEHRSLVVHVDKLRPNPWNYNTQGDRTFGKLVSAIRRLGFTKPIIVRSNPGVTPFEIVDGEHRWRAAKLIGMTEVPVVDLGGLDVVPDVRAKQLTIALNELSGTPDDARLGDLLRDVVKDVNIDELVDVLPFSASEIDAYVSVIDFSFDKLPKGDVRPEGERLGESTLVTGAKTKQYDAKRRLVLTFHGSDAVTVEKLCGLLGEKTTEDAVLAALNHYADQLGLQEK